jgi:hypothetical protein
MATISPESRITVSDPAKQTFLVVESVGAAFFTGSTTGAMGIVGAVGPEGLADTIELGAIDTLLGALDPSIDGEEVPPTMEGEEVPPTMEGEEVPPTRENDGAKEALGDLDAPLGAVVPVAGVGTALGAADPDVLGTALGAADPVVVGTALGAADPVAVGGTALGAADPVDVGGDITVVGALDTPLGAADPVDVGGTALGAADPVDVGGTALGAADPVAVGLVTGGLMEGTFGGIVIEIGNMDVPVKGNIVAVGAPPVGTEIEIGDSLGASVGDSVGTTFSASSVVGI